VANTSGRRRRSGARRKLPSGRIQTRYLGPDGLERTGRETFASKTDADAWLSEVETDMRRGEWRDPLAGAGNFTLDAEAWITERTLGATTEELYRRLLRLHLAPVFGTWDLDEISAPRVRAWRADLLAHMGHASVRAAMIHQHATAEQQRKISTGISAAVVEIRSKQPEPPGSGATWMRQRWRV
jgi:hypothetical protein